MLCFIISLAVSIVAISFGRATCIYICICRVISSNLVVMEVSQRCPTSQWRGQTGNRGRSLVCFYYFPEAILFYGVDRKRLFRRSCITLSNDLCSGSSAHQQRCIIYQIFISCQLQANVPPSISHVRKMRIKPSVLRPFP